MKTEYVALSRKVLAVAVEGAVGDWAAYVGAVEGTNHNTEFSEIAATGTKLPQKVAELLFPSWKHLKWRR